MFLKQTKDLGNLGENANNQLFLTYVFYKEKLINSSVDRF